MTEYSERDRQRGVLIPEIPSEPFVSLAEHQRIMYIMEDILVGHRVRETSYKRLLNECETALNGLLVAMKLGIHVDQDIAINYAMEIFAKLKARKMTS